MLWHRWIVIAEVFCHIYRVLIL